MEVVPTAMTGRSWRRSFSISDLVTLNGSLCMLCSATLLLFTGRNVPAPTCRHTVSSSIPLLRMSESTFSVKCRPAVGAATDPLWRAYRVWYLSESTASVSLLR